MRSLRKRMERAALKYNKRTGLSACTELECWVHKGNGVPETSLKFSWFTTEGLCELKFFKDVDALESFADGIGRETINDA